MDHERNANFRNHRKSNHDLQKNNVKNALIYSVPSPQALQPHQ